jgi:hypothetical protein
VLEFFDRLGRRVHRDHRGRRQPVGVRGELLGGERVERAAGRAAHLVVADEGHGEAGGRIEHGEVQSEFVEPLVE